MSDVTIFHNPSCSTSRNTLALIRQAGIEPRVVEYLKAMPSKDEVKRLLSEMGLTVRDLLRVEPARIEPVPGDAALRQRQGGSVQRAAQGCEVDCADGSGAAMG